MRVIVLICFFIVTGKHDFPLELPAAQFNNNLTDCLLINNNQGEL